MRSNNFLLFAAPASLIGSELSSLHGFGPSLSPAPIAYAAATSEGVDYSSGPWLYGAPAFYNLVVLAASYWGTGPSSTNAAFSLRPSALRGASGGATMAIPGGASTLYVTGS